MSRFGESDLALCGLPATLPGSEGADGTWTGGDERHRDWCRKIDSTDNQSLTAATRTVGVVSCLGD